LSGVSDWATDYVQWAVSVGLLSANNGNVDGQGAVTQSQMAEMLLWQFSQGEI